MIADRDEDAPDLPVDHDFEEQSAGLSALAAEAKSHWLPSARVGLVGAKQAAEAERKLFAKIDAHEQRGIARIGLGGDSRFWRPVALITAVAAGVVFFAHPKADGPSAGLDSAGVPSVTVPEGPLPAPEPARPTAPAELAAVTGGGELRVDGVAVAVREASLRDAQKVEAHGGEAVFTAPGRAAWLLENGTEVSTVRAGTHGGAVILALRVGAVEAQVTPVPAGEAFAVDVDGIRVAVHGTHLRVARAAPGGDRVVVDLTEGTILIGTPPKAGATIADGLVTAPAHVEFSVNDLAGTLVVSHDPARVRAAVDPTSLAQSAEVPPSVGSIPASPAAAQNVAAPTTLGSRALNANAPKLLTPEEKILAAVRGCADGIVGGGSGALTIHSTLTVKVNPDGTNGGVFVPPLAPEMQACVSNVIFSTRWADPGPHVIPIDLKR